MQQRDLAVREELAADGSLFDGYHPRMAQVHRENAQGLRNIIAEFGWPDEVVAGADAAEAAWLIAQHAISEPDFMRRCRDLLAEAVSAGRAPAWQYAYLDDRIRVSEGRPQRFGTQFERTPDGPTVCVVEEPDHLDERRKSVGLGRLADRLKAAASEPRPTESEYSQRKTAEFEWRRTMGWITDSGE